MTQAEIILNRLCELQGTNFQVTDVKVTEHQILWQIEHKEKAVYVCARCKAELNHSHDNRWITIQDVPFGMRKCIWRVKRHRILCTCTMNVGMETGLPLFIIKNPYPEDSKKYPQKRPLLT